MTTTAKTTRENRLSTQPIYVIVGKSAVDESEHVRFCNRTWTRERSLSTFLRAVMHVAAENAGKLNYVRLPVGRWVEQTRHRGGR